MMLKFDRFNPHEELGEQRALFIECFPETIGTPVCSEEHYRWKFHSKPQNSALESVEYCVRDEQEMIGYYAAIPYDYKVGDTIIRAAMVCDVMTGIKARGKGVFTRLGTFSTAEMAKSGFDITTGYPIRPEVIPGHLKVGWKITLDLPMYGRFIRFDAIFRKKRIGFLAPAANRINIFFSHINRIFFLNKKNNLDIKIYDNLKINEIEGLNHFYSKWQCEVPIALIKDTAFLNWRLNAPERKYEIFVLYNQDEIVGVLIATDFVNMDIPCTGILDLTLLDGYHQKSCLLMDALVRSAEERKRELVLLMISRYWYRQYKLLSSLFIRTPFKFYLIVKNLSGKVADEIFKRASNWHLMWIDSDDL